MQDMTSSTWRDVINVILTDARMLITRYYMALLKAVIVGRYDASLWRNSRRLVRNFDEFAQGDR